MQQRLTVDGKEWLFTCVSMGNPHAITFGLSDGTPIKVCVKRLVAIGPETTTAGRRRLGRPNHAVGTARLPCLQVNDLRLITQTPTHGPMYLHISNKF